MRAANYPIIVTLRIELLDILENATSVPPVPHKLWLIWTMIAKAIRHGLRSRLPPGESSRGIAAGEL